MNSALLKEREEFRKRAMAVPVVENKKRKVEEPPKKNSNKPAASTEKVSLNLMSESILRSIIVSTRTIGTNGL